MTQKPFVVPPPVLNLLNNIILSNLDIRRLVAWSALSLVDLLQHKTITIYYAEKVLFNLDMIQYLKKKGLDDCVKLIDWGMQLEDWADHTPEQISEALNNIAQIAEKMYRK